MDLPPELRTALDRLLDGVSASALAPVAESQSDTYRHRADHGLGRLLVRSEVDALAYAAWRLPATFGATRSALDEVDRLMPGLAPRSHLDLGAGPGTALVAARAVFDTLERSVALEGSKAFRALGARLFDELDTSLGPAPEWRPVDLSAPGAIDAACATAPATGERFDLVTLCYVTGEIGTESRMRLIDDGWARSSGLFVIVEPGTTAGHARLMEARTRLLGAGAHVVGPCPHEAPCPIRAPDWCHFAVRVARSRTHRRVKGADLGYEDEKYAWLAVSRTPTERAAGRVLRPVRAGKAAVELDVCGDDGQAGRHAMPRRSKEAYRVAKKLRWGDAVPAELLTAARRVGD